MTTRRPLGRRAMLADSALAATVFAAILIGYLIPPHEESSGRFAAGLALLVAMHLVLVVRRVVPVAVLAVTTAAFVFHAALDQPYVSPLAGVVAVYSVAAYTDRRAALGAGAIALAATLGGNWLQTRDSFQWTDMISIAVALSAAWVVGERIGRSRERTAALESQTRTLARERDARARAAAEEERARIARELHDVVSHNLSVIVVQAGGARRIAAGDPHRAREALAAIETTGRQALAEMRRLLGIVREPASAGTLEPTGGVGALGGLVERVRAAGRPVALVVEGTPEALPAGIDVSVFRIVQESLTNVMKHAGGASARVLVRYEPDAVEVVVVDDGRGPATTGDGGGQGLLGMRERVLLFGGTFHAGPRADGGFEVIARLPVREAR